MLASRLPRTKFIRTDIGFSIPEPPHWHNSQEPWSGGKFHKTKNVLFVFRTIPVLGHETRGGDHSELQPPRPYVGRTRSGESEITPSASPARDEHGAEGQVLGGGEEEGSFLHELSRPTLT